MAYASRMKSVSMGRGARNSYLKYGSKVPKGEFIPKGNARSGGSASKMRRMKPSSKAGYDPMSGSQYRQKYG